MATAQIRVRLDKLEAEQDAKDLGASIVGSLTPVVDVGNLATKAFGALQSVLSSAYDFVKQGVQDSAAAAQQELKLEQALTVRGQATLGVVEALNEYNSAIMQQTNLEDNALLALETKLVKLGVQTSQLKQATEASIGLSEITGGDLQSSAVIVTKVLNGQTDALRRAGIFSRDTADAMRQLGEAFNLASVNVQGAAGQVELIKKNFGELQEAIGDPIARNAGVVGGLEATNSILVKMTELVQKTPGLVKSIAGQILDPLSGTPLSAEAIASRKAAIENSLKEAEDNRGLRGAPFLANLSLEQPEGFDPNRGMSKKEQELWAKLDAERLAREQASARALAAEKRRASDEEQRWRESVAERENAAWNAQEEAKRAHELRISEIEKDAQDQRRANTLNAEAEDAERERAWQARQEEARAAFAESGIRMAAGFVASMGAMIGSAAANGEDASAVLKRAAGQGIAMIGAMIVELGTAAVAAGVLGTAVPLLGIVTGGPGAIAAGSAAIAVGTAIIAGGSALGARAPSSRGNRSVATTQARASRTEATSDPFGFLGGGSQEKTSIFQVNFNGGIFGGDPRRVGRELRDLIMDGGSLVPSGAR